MDGAGQGEDDPPAKSSPWEGFLAKKTPWQRWLLAIGGVAGAVVSIGTVVITLAGWLGGSDDGGGDERVRSAAAFAGRTIESGTDEGDDLVRLLVAADGGEPVALDLTVLSPEGRPIDPYLPLWYNCAPGAVVGSGVCNLVRLEFPGDIPVQTLNPLGWRFQGNYRVTVRNGHGYGTDLDISFDDIST
jgi:hypothetical protein